MGDGGFPAFHLNTTLTREELLDLLGAVATKTGVRIDRLEIGQLHIHVGEACMERTKGDVTVGNITGSTVGAIGTARDVSVFNNRVDALTTLAEEEKAALKAARRTLDDVPLPAEDKEDVTHNLDRLTDELSKREPEAGRVQRFLQRIKEVAPPVAATLSIAASIAKLAAG